MRGHRRVVFVVVAMSAATLGAANGPATRADLPAPRMTALAIGPTMIRVTIEPIPREPLDVALFERRSASASDDRRSFEFPRYLWPSPSKATTLHEAEPDTTYVYRVRGHYYRGDSPWSDDVTVRTPAEPSTPPAAPERLSARAVSPFAIALHWESRSHGEYGFEITRRDDTGRFVRVALVDPGTTRYVHHGQRPSTTRTYRVRAFNPRGASSESNAASARTLPISTPPVLPAGTRLPSAGPCTSQARVVQTLERPDGPVPPVLRIDLGAQRAVDFITVPQDCGQNCTWFVHGRYDGCYRRLGEIFAAIEVASDVHVVARRAADWPVIETTSHHNAAKRGSHSGSS